MLAHRLRRWPNIKPALVQCLVLGYFYAITVVYYLRSYYSLSDNICDPGAAHL